MNPLKELFEALDRAAELEEERLREPVTLVAVIQEGVLTPDGDSVLWHVCLNGKTFVTVPSEALAVSIGRNFGGLAI